MTTATRTTSAVALVAVIVAATTLAYVFRDRLAGLPVIGARVASNVAATTPAGGAARPRAPSPVDPRAPVSLDLRRQQLSGVRTAVVQHEAVARTVRTVGLVRYDETRLADVNLRLDGWIRDLYVDYTGRFVQQGEPLFTLYSPDLLTTQQEYLLALRTRDQLRQSQIADVRERADRLVEAARQRIALWDLPDDLVRTLDETRAPRTEVTVRSPVSGYVIEKEALKGMHVTAGQTLYKVADLSRVWVEAELYEQELSLVRLRQAATVTLDAYPGERFSGRIVYIYPYVEEQTRTVRVRFDLANRGGRLRPGMYANVVLESPMGMGTTIPANALLDSGTRQLVFVAEGDGYFQPRDVTVGQRLGERVQILDGLQEGEVVAMGGTFFLDSESQLRASVQGFAPAPAASAGGGDRLDITFRSDPDPPRAGDTVVEVSVRDNGGAPIEHADVSVTFFMASMPSMNMPAMRSEATLGRAGGGVYRGSIEVLSAGRWDVTVAVIQQGERLGSGQFSVVAR